MAPSTPCEPWLSHRRGCFRGLSVVGLPLVVDDQLFNCAAVLHRGRSARRRPQVVPAELQGVLRRPLLRPGRRPRIAQPSASLGADVPFGTDLLFRSANVTDRVRRRRRDLRGPVDAGPAELAAGAAGATVLANLSASNEMIGKAALPPAARRQPVGPLHRRRTSTPRAAPGESTTDLVFGGHCLIAENGTLLAESRAVPPRRAPARRRRRPRPPAARPAPDEQLRRRAR